jgi:hypothetical protein
MGWKPKEKPLTAEQAIEMVKAELAPWWFGSAPLVAAVRQPRGGAVTLHPLDEAFKNRARLIFVLDPTGFAGEEMLFYIKEWHRRYKAHELEFLLVLKPCYKYLRQPTSIERFIRREQIPFPITLDHDGLLAAAFAAEAEYPKLLLIASGQFVFQSEGPQWFVDAELKLQKFLRSRDPGLSLLEPFAPAEGQQPLKDVGKFDLGRGRGVSFPAAGFKLSGAFGIGGFRGTRPQQLKPGQLFISGTWMQDEERIATSDSSSVIGFRSSGSHVSVLAECVAKPGEEARIEILIDGGPVWDEIRGEHLVLSEEGTSIVEVEKPGLYHLLAKLPAGNREITLRFPQASRKNIALYAIRMGD